MRRIVTTLAAAAAAPVLLLAAAAPASAGIADNCGYGVTCAAAAQFVPSTETPTGSDLYVACGAASSYQVVLFCWAEGSRGDVHVVSESLTGSPVATMAQRFPASVLFGRAYRVCVAAGVYRDGTYYAPSGHVCAFA